MKKAILFLVIILSAIAFWGWAQMESYCFFYPSIDTRFAPGYSEASFNKIAVGMSKLEVEQKLGRPLDTGSVFVNGGGDELWYYTLDGKCKWGDWAWLKRVIRFSNGRIVGIENRIAYD